LEKVKQKENCTRERMPEWWRIGTLHNSQLFGQKKIARERHALSDEGY
jgi:hypothetical protein